MDKKIYLALCDRLKKVEDLRWVDFDEGQLSITGERPPVAFPCCLIDLQYPSCRDLDGFNQIVTLNIILKIGFQPRGETYAAAPEPVRQRALEVFDTVQKVHEAIQGELLGGMVSEIARRRAVKSVRRDGIQVYTVTYDTTFEETDD
jgi:hypothetical protein